MPIHRMQPTVTRKLIYIFDHTGTFSKRCDLHSLRSSVTCPLYFPRQRFTKWAVLYPREINHITSSSRLISLLKYYIPVVICKKPICLQAHAYNFHNQHIITFFASSLTLSCDSVQDKRSYLLHATITSAWVPLLLLHEMTDDDTAMTNPSGRSKNFP